MSTRAWHQEPWVWTLIAIPFTAVAFGFFMLYTATIYKDDLVVDDYYKDGKAINQRLAMDEAAARLGVIAVLDASGGLVVEGASDAALAVNFYHVTSRDLDRQYVAVPEEDGFYRVEEGFGDLFNKPGIWYLEVRGVDANWRVRQRVVMPQPDVELTP